MKLLYYIDFISFSERRSPVTGDVYYKLPYGPVPTFVKNEIDNLELPPGSEVVSQLSDSLALQEKTYGKVVIKKVTNYNLQKLSDYEKGLIDEVIQKIGSKSSTFLTNKTHKEKPYLLTNANSVIDYELADTLNGRAVLEG
jgi:uncharacterized phage-associated protein